MHQPPIIDAHQNLMRHLDRCHDPEQRQTDFRLLREAGVALVVSSIFSEHATERRSNDFVTDQINRYHRAAQEHSGFLIVENALTLNHVLTGDELGVILHIEGAEALESRDREMILQLWKEVGVRSVGIVWNETNNLGGGAYGIRGLTKIGQEVIRWLDANGMIVDLAHMNAETFWDTMQLVEHPPVISHGNCWTLSPHPRNYTDDQIRQVAWRGGVIGLSCVPNFVNNRKRAMLSDVIRHFLHVIELVGIDHVGFGTDFGGILDERLIADADKVTALPYILEVLESYGFSQINLKKIAWGNFARVIRQRLT
ncbi:MAG: membrane dipeptidase [Candidatus Uhrbacteria bacterium]|nr:membrane dipeptidase [Patescibacteria group bacterium]MBU1906668.1 membrane dipeptidase [Patescibacteria group bacterium]